MTPEERQSKAIEAKQFMQHPLWAQMFDGVADYLENAALTCDRKDEKIAADIIRCKQLLRAMQREIERRAEDGDFAAFELEQVKKPGLIRRLIR